MNDSETMVRAINSYYNDLSLYNFNKDILNDPQVDLEKHEKQRAEAAVGRYKGQALQTLGYIKMRFLKDIENAPRSIKELWSE